jgi:hypothetical protein
VIVIGADFGKPLKPKPYPPKPNQKLWRTQRLIPRLDREALRQRVRQ